MTLRVARWFGGAKQTVRFTGLLYHADPEKSVSVQERCMKWLLVLLPLLWAGSVGAENLKSSNTGYQKWKQECGSCHVAFPPRMMSVENWQQLMDGLDKHFGSNASLDKADLKVIKGFLQRYGGSGPSHISASLRITDTPWFKREHRIISEKEWRLDEVRTKSNCAACHGPKVIGD